MIALDGMHGLGDNLYQRAVLRYAGCNVLLRTPWPQLYADMNHVRCVQMVSRLRTQRKNLSRPGLNWIAASPYQTWRRWHYVGRQGSVLAGLFAGAQIPIPGEVDFSGPPIVAELPRGVQVPYVVVRPATVRREWRAEGRNPLPEYLVRASSAARRAGFQVISVADLADGEEWLQEPAPEADLQFHSGELVVEQLMGLVARAAGLIGGVGWLLPAAMAYKMPMLLVYGGWGVPNCPDKVIPQQVDSSFIVQAMPDKFCMCERANHACDKTISKLNEYIDEFIVLAHSRQQIALAA